MPGQDSGHKMAYMIVGLFALIVIVAVAIPFTFNIFKKGNQAAIDKQVVTEDTKALNDYKNDSSLESQEAYVKATDQRLAESDVSDPARNLLLLRKAAVLSQARGDAATLSGKIADATKIYIDFINKPNPNESDLYFRDFSIVALTRVQLQCCNVTADIMPLVPIFNEEFQKYMAAGYNKSLAALLALDVSTGKLSPTRQGDAMNRLNSLDLESKILAGYGDELQPGTRDGVVKALGETLKAYPTMKQLTYNDPSTIFEAGNKLAIANDWYKSLSSDGQSASVNKEIDRQYEDAQATVRAAMSTVKDIHGLNEVMFYNLVYYIESLDRRYGANVDTAKRNAAVAEVLNIIKTTPTISDVAKLYFQGQQNWKTSNPDEWKKLDAFNHFVALGKTNTAVATYLKSINVTP